MTMAPELTASFLLLAERNASPTYAEELARNWLYRPVGRTHSITTAVEIVRTRRPEVVIADVAGVERLQRVAAAVPRLRGARVVVVSSLPAELALLATMAAGVQAFLLKPLDSDLLERTMAAVLAGHTVVDPRCTSWLVELALHGHRARMDNSLTLRQSQVLALVRGGLTNREIGRVLGLSIDTVKTHLRQAMKRLGAHDRWAATELADRLRVPDPPREAE